MIELIALAFAILAVWAARMIRVIGAVPFQRVHMAFTEDRPSRELLAEFEEAMTKAQALGFEAPQWVQVRGEADGVKTLFALLLHPEGTWLLLGNPEFASHPRRLQVLVSTEVEDGRTMTTAAFDTTLAAGSSEWIVARVGDEPELEDLIAGHREWLHTSGRTGCAQASVMDLEREIRRYERHRQGMIAAGHLMVVDEVLALPRLGFTFRLLKAYLQRPKPPAESGPIPAALLEGHVHRAERVASRAPPRRMELSLFVVSTLVFGVAGALLFNLETAIGLLLAITVHELGHYVAMRVLGYRNVHMLALPLVGGVTMGRDPAPSAGRNAWVSLMGPLPGLLIGAVLIVFAGLAGFAEGTSWLWLFAAFFLVINYLNLLPILPLDGGRVLQSLLPPRWAKLQTVVFFAIGVAGLVAALFAQMWVLGLIFGTQLLGVRRRWRIHDLEAALARQKPPGRAYDETPALFVLEALERYLGPADSAKRVQEAVALRDRLRTAPMSRLGACIVGGVYSLCLMGPMLVGGLLVLGGALSHALPDRAEEEAAHEQAVAQAKRMSMQELVAAVQATDGQGPRQPATPAQLEQAQARLGAPLPDDLRELYQVANGVPALEIEPLHKVRTATRGLLLLASSEAETGYGVDLSGYDPDTVWQLGGQMMKRVYLASPAEPLQQTPLLVLRNGFLIRKTTVRDFVEREAQLTLYEARVAVIHKRRMRTGLQALEGLSLRELIEQAHAVDDPLAALVRPVSSGISQDDLQAAEGRIARPLHPQLLEVLRDADPPGVFNMLPSDALVVYGDSGAQLPQWGTSSSSVTVGSGTYTPHLVAEDIASCIVVAGRNRGEQAMAALLLWCPNNPSAIRWLDTSRLQGYPDLRAWLRDRVALQGVY